MLSLSVLTISFRLFVLLVSSSLPIFVTRNIKMTFVAGYSVGSMKITCSFFEYCYVLIDFYNSTYYSCPGRFFKK